MNRFSSFYAFFFLAVLFSGLAACVDQEFDEPPVRDLTDLQANATIADLKALHSPGSDPTLITEPLLIEGIVAADDKSENFFRQIAIQDVSGGIILRLNATGLFNDFPVGTRLIVVCEGLYIGDYNNLYQINGSPDSGIEDALISRHLFIAERGLTVDPVVVTIEELENQTIFDDLLATLVKFENIQFIDASTEVPYADVANRLSVNLTLTDCEGHEIIVRTSGFAEFANELTPSGNGSLTALLTVFGNTRQLVLRDLSDVQLTGDRCSGAEGGEVMSISDLRAAFDTGSTAGPEGKKIRGVVISDGASGNWTGRNLVVQDGTAGIVIRFSDNHDFSMGEEIEINVSSQELSEFNGLLQVNDVPNNLAVSFGNGTMPAPREVTIDQLLTNMGDDQSWESTLVAIEKVTFEDSGTFSGSKTIKDASGSTALFTRSQANFAGEAVPAGEVKIIAIVSEFNGLQLNLRNNADIFSE